MVGLFGACLIGYFSQEIIMHTYGSNFIQSANILSVHIWTGIFVFHVSIRSRVLVAKNLQHLSLYFMFFGVAVNIIGNYWLIPLYGGLGAAYASWISWCMNVILFPLFNKNTRKLVYIFIVSPLECLFKGYCYVTKK